MRFYVEGYEIDVQDPRFFTDEVEYIALNEALEEMIEYHSEAEF